MYSDGAIGRLFSNYQEMFKNENGHLYELHIY